MTKPIVLDSFALLAYADASALATAIRENAVLLTCNAAFRAASDLVEIQWI